jgi:hypothetical protein
MRGRGAAAADSPLLWGKSAPPLSSPGAGTQRQLLPPSIAPATGVVAAHPLCAGSARLLVRCASRRRHRWRRQRRALDGCSALLIQRKRPLAVVYSTGKVEALELRVSLEESEARSRMGRLQRGGCGEGEGPGRSDHSRGVRGPACGRPLRRELRARPPKQTKGPAAKAGPRHSRGRNRALALSGSRREKGPTTPATNWSASWETSSRPSSAPAQAIA